MIKLQRVQKIIEGRTELDLDNLEFKVGSVSAIVGPEGSGIRILFDLLIGKARPSSGSVEISGSDPVSDPQSFSNSVGVMFADDGLYVRQSARSNLRFQSRLWGVPRTRADDVLKEVGLLDSANTRVDNLSSGLARRLAFGRAILHDPLALLLVEPFERCDGATITLLGRLIRQQAEAGKTVLIMAADTANLLNLCDKIVVINQGKIEDRFEPTAEQVAETPFKIPVRMEGSVALVNPADILFADAEEGRAFIQTRDQRLSTQYTLQELEHRLGERGFFRAHRGYLVNLQHIIEVIPFTRSSFSLRLDDDEGTLIPLSKTAAAELRELLGY